MPASSAATVFGIMSWIGYCDSSTLTPRLGLVLLDRLVERIVLRLVEALDPPDGELFLGQRLAGEGQRAGGDDAGDRLSHRVSSWVERAVSAAAEKPYRKATATLNPGFAKVVRTTPRAGSIQPAQLGLRLSMKACTPSSALSSIMLQAIVRPASS